MPNLTSSVTSQQTAERSEGILRRAESTIAQSKETIRISKEVLRVSREIESDRQGHRHRKASKRSTW